MRSHIRAFFARKAAECLDDAGLSEQVQLLFENVQLSPSIGTRKWVELRLNFSEEAGGRGAGHLHLHLLRGQLFGVAGVPLGSGMEGLDQMIDCLSGGLSHIRRPELASYEMVSEEPFVSTIYHCTRYRLDFVSNPNEVLHV